MSEVVTLPTLLTEKEAAARLGVSSCTLQRMRRAGEIAYLKIAGRLVRYTEKQLTDYLEAATCRETNEPVRSAITGSPREPIRRTGAAPGSIQLHDRRAVKALALQTFARPSKSSPAGSSKTPTVHASKRSN